MHIYTYNSAFFHIYLLPVFMEWQRHVLSTLLLIGVVLNFSPVWVVHGFPLGLIMPIL